MAERLDLADALEKWLRRERLGLVDVIRNGGVSKTSLHRIQHGESVNVGTLRKVARGLATDPHTKRFDQAVYREAVTDLMEAAGLRELVPDAQPSLDLEAEVRRLVPDHETAERIVAALRRWDTLSDGERDLLRAALRMIAEPRASDG